MQSNETIDLVAAFRKYLNEPYPGSTAKKKAWDAIGKITGEATPQCFRCGSFDKVSFSPDPYAHEINDDDSPVHQCESCAHESAMDI